MDFEREVARYKQSVYRQLVRLCGNREDAEDALVEALLNAYQALGTLNNCEAFAKWLSVIAKRACIRVKRHSSLEPLLSLCPTDELLPSRQPLTEFEAEMMHLCIEDALNSLPTIYREAFVKREIEGLDAASAARELNVSIPALKSRAQRGRLRLQRALDGALCLQVR